MFISSHPLADVRDALRARVDCPLSALASKQDGAWVTVGGLITEVKRIRTKSGEPMMFATLDDLDGQVEMLIFNAAYAAAESKAALDRRVIVRGRVDHKDRGETKLIVQEVEEFNPSSDEIEQARAKPVDRSDESLVLKVDAKRFGDSLIGDLKSVLEHFPGSTEVMLEIDTTAGTRRLRFGSGCRVTLTHGLRAELTELLGPETSVPA
jgi:DNA polymerase-3 subunit alpha